ncbi:MAG: HAD family hydrolase [Planctomycetota bacterium]|jgi:alpha,alpha-trehalase
MPDPVTPERFDAVLFDLDGVITATAKVHARAWKRMFDAYLERRAERTGEPARPFDIDTDYRLYVDGKPRYEGVRSFLESRGISLPEGEVDDAPDAETVCGLGNRKNELINDVIASEGVEVFETTVTWIRHLQELGIHVAVVSSSKNCETILRAARLDALFEVRVDGVVAAELGLPGKPAPDTFLEAARRLGIEPDRAVVVEDAIVGVQAGRAGGFGLVIGVDRHDEADDLRAGGADIVVSDLGELASARTG